MPDVPVPASWDYGDKVTSAKLQATSDAVAFLLAPPICKVTSTVVQSLPDNTTTAIVWNSALRDPMGMWDAAAPTKLVAPYPGDYIVLPIIEIGSDASGSRRIDIRINGSQLDGAMRRSVLAASPEGLAAGNTVRLSEGDYVEILATLTGAGGALDTGLSGFNPKCSLIWVHS